MEAQQNENGCFVFFNRKTEDAKKRKIGKKLVVLADIEYYSYSKKDVKDRGAFVGHLLFSCQKNKSTKAVLLPEVGWVKYGGLSRET